MWAVRDLHEHDRATTLAAECVAVARRHALPQADLGFALWIQSAALYIAGDLEGARAAGAEAEALWRRTGVHWGLSRILHLLSLIELDLGAVERAARLCRAAIAVLGGDGEAHFVARSIEGLALALVRGGAGPDAARLLGAATAIRERIGMPLLPYEEARHANTLEVVESSLDPAAHARFWAEGRAMALPEVIAFATAPAA